MKLGDFRMYFIKQLTPSWIKGDPEKNTADQIVCGDPNRDVKTCIVTWISSFVALRKAVERNFDLIVTHEPTFYGHSIKQIDNREVLFGEGVHQEEGPIQSTGGYPASDPGRLQTERGSRCGWKGTHRADLYDPCTGGYRGDRV